MRALPRYIGDIACQLRFWLFNRPPLIETQSISRSFIGLPCCAGTLSLLVFVSALVSSLAPLHAHTGAPRHRSL